MNTKNITVEKLNEAGCNCRDCVVRERTAERVRRVLFALASIGLIVALVRVLVG